MRANKISLNIFLSCLKAQGLDVEFFYDRVKLYVDSATKKVNIERICPDVKRQKIIPRTLLHYDTMYLMIDARQPDNTYFDRLKWMVDGHYVVNYAEFAMDIFCKDRIQVSKLRKLLNSVLVLERKRCNIRFYHRNGERKKGKDKGKGKNTHYFGSRFLKHEDILVIYSDGPSKVDGKSYCVHIEMRLRGSKILKHFKIYTIQDLIDFQHETIWDHYLDLRDVNYTKLGRLVTKEKTGLTDSSYRRRGQNYFNEFVGSQALLMEHPHLTEAFTPIKNRRMFESRLDNALR